MKRVIKLNGRTLTTECTTLYHLKQEYQTKAGLVDDEVVAIYNGFQMAEDCALEADDEVFLISKGAFPPEDQLEAMMAARHTPEVHERLKQGRVAIAGLGGLGSNLAVSLARIGVGELLLVDFDTVEPSNLNRQHYDIRHLGQLKTDALRSQLENINPFIRIQTESVRFSEENCISLFTGYDVICEAFDRPQTKALLTELVLSQLPDTPLVAASGMAGYSSANTITTIKKMKRLYLCGDTTQGAKPGEGLMAPRVQVCAGHMANMVLRLLVGEQDA